MDGLDYQQLHGGGGSVCNTLKKMKMYKVVLVASLFLIIVPLIIHYYLVNVSKIAEISSLSSF